MDNGKDGIDTAREAAAGFPGRARRILSSIAIPVVLVLLSISLGILVAGYYVNRGVFYDVFEERERNKAENINLTIQSLIQGEVKRISSFAKVLKDDSDLAYGLYHHRKTQGDAGPLRSVMNKLSSQVNLNIFVVTDPKGRVLYRADGGKENEVPGDVNPLAKGAKGKPVITASWAPGGWGIRAIVPLHVFDEKASTALLVIGSRIDDGFAVRIARETGSQVSISSKEGVVGSSHRDAGAPVVDASLVSRSLVGDRPIFFTDRKGFRSYTYVPLKILEEEFCLVIGTDIGVVRDLLGKNAAKMVQWGLLLFAGITAIGLVVTVILIRPLNALQAKARQVIAEYSPERTREIAPGSEISTLVQAINLMVNSIKDHIAERTRAEEALRETSHALQALVEASPLAIVLADASGQVRVWNPAASGIFGWREDEVLGRACTDLLGGDNPELGAVCDLVLKGEKFFNREIACRGRNGSAIDLVFSGAPLADGQHRIVGMMAIMADVTEANRAGEALRRSEEMLRQSQKMEAVGKLAGGVAHDFNNILMVISGYSELLAARDEARGTKCREVDEIRKAAVRATSLTRQLLAFSRRQVLRPLVLDLNGVLENIDRMLGRLIGEDIELRTEATPGLWAIKADPSQVDQIIMNLAVNARDAMPGGGMLSIVTANLELNRPRVEGSLTIPPGKYVTLGVADTGCGMDEQTLSRIFEPFFTTKEQGKGTGLGLATVYGIVKQSGGFIVVQSRPGGGTTFTVYFPRHEEHEAAAGEVPGEEGEPEQGGNETILVVEDEDTVRELACVALKGYGFSVLEAADGKEALEISGRHEGPIHLLLTDVTMPGMNGLELARKLTAVRPGIAVLLMSGYAGGDLADVAAGTKEMGFLQKPITPRRLARKVREALSGRGTGAAV